MIGRALGPYRLDRELGVGGMGKVFAATVEKTSAGLPTGTRVALKVVHPHLLESEGFFKRFLNEAEIGKAVRHPNVVRTYDADALRHEGSDCHFLVMEYVEGQTLRSLLEELEKVPEELCRHIGREVAKGLAAIHAAGAVHRDLKPENVLITADHQVKVMDLGVARLREEAVRLSRTGAFAGSLLYAAPEQFSGAGEEVDTRVDLHALGLVLYELSAGFHPYQSDEAAQVLRKVLHEEPRRLGDVNPQLSPFYEEVVHTLLQKDPAKRLKSATEVHRILDEGEKSPWWAERSRSIRSLTKRPLRRIRIPRETALYGRDGELQKLRALYEKAKSGEGQVLLLEGEAGIGKSRLVDEFVGQLQRDGEELNFLFGSYPPGGAATASGAFSTAYREHLGDAGLEDAVRECLGVAGILAPSYAALLLGTSAPAGAEPLTKDSLQTCFVHTTRSLATERMTVVLIDDLHFAPEEGRSLFASLSHAVPGHPILLVGTTRPGVDEKWLAQLTRLPQATHLAVPRLGPKDMVRLLADALHSERLASELAGQIALKSDGNPFFVFEILRGLREGQFLTQKPDGTWVTTKVIRDIQIPSSVADLVNARVADLSEEERDLLDVASCHGFEFDPLVVAAATGLARVPALKRFAWIEKKHRLVRGSGRLMAFDHHQVQEALYGSLLDPLREEYHAALASTLETRSEAASKDTKDLDGALCVDLAEQFLKGAQGPRAIRYFDAALAHLEKGYLNDAAVRLAERALAVPGLLVDVERFEILGRKAARLEVLGRADAERATLDETLALADADGDPGRRARARSSLGWLLVRLSRLAEAEPMLCDALELARSCGDRKLEAAATVNLGNAFRSLSRFPEALEQYERGAALSREIGERRTEAKALGNVGVVCNSLGRQAEAQDHLDRCLAICREMGDRRGEAVATLGLGNVSLSRSQVAMAREFYERCLSLAREVGDRRTEAYATGNLGHICSSLGRYTEALEQFERCLTLAREMGDRQGEAVTLGNLGSIFLQQGRFAEALVHCERGLAIRRDIGDRRGEALVLSTIGSVHLASGATEQARECFETSMVVSREIGNREGEVVALCNLGLHLKSLDRYRDAREYLKQGLAIARDIGARENEAVMLVNLGPIWLALGDPHRAREALDASLAICRESGLRYPEGYALQGLGAIADELGDSVAALRLAGDALALRREIGHADGIAESLLELGDYRHRAGDLDGACAAVDEAVAMSRLNGWKPQVALGLALLACLRGGDPVAAEVALGDAGERADTPYVRLLLWKATGNRSHLEEAKRQLDDLLAKNPDHRESMLANVRLHREITAAWKEHGEPSPSRGDA